VELRLTAAAMLASVALAACGGSSPPTPSAATIKTACLHEVSLFRQVATQITALKTAATSLQFPATAADLRKAAGLIDTVATAARPLDVSSSGLASVRSFANDMRAFAHQISVFNVTGMTQAERKIQSDGKTLAALPGGKDCASYRHLVPAFDTP